MPIAGEAFTSIRMRLARGSEYIRGEFYSGAAPSHGIDFRVCSSDTLSSSIKVLLRIRRGLRMCARWLHRQDRHPKSGTLSAPVPFSVPCGRFLFVRRHKRPSRRLFLPSARASSTVWGQWRDRADTQHAR